MNKKIKIDEIYREKLKGIETTPPEDSWETILAGLPEKNKRRFLPIWYGLATTAAALVIFFFLPKVYLFNPPQSTSSPLTIEQEREIYIADPISEDFIKYMREASATLENIRSITEKSSARTPGLFEIQTNNGEKQPTSGISNLSGKNLYQPKGGGNSFSEERIAKNSKKDLPGTKIIGIYLTSQDLVTEDPNIKGSKNLTDLYTQVPSEILEKPLDKDEIKLPETSSLVNRFSLATTAGAVYLDKFGKGNLFAGQLEGNEERGKMTASYGVYLAYQISENVKVRSGLSKVDFNYSTQNISYSAVLSSQVIFAPPSPSRDWMEYPGKGSLEQGFSFLEIPMEVEYGLIKGKWELNLISGISSYFLRENNVSFTDGYNTANFGAGRNLKDLSLSANIGIGINIPLTGQLNFTMEPFFKYQINTFKNSLDVNPYYIGLYSGLRYNF